MTAENNGNNSVPPNGNGYYNPNNDSNNNFNSNRNNGSYNYNNGNHTGPRRNKESINMVLYQMYELLATGYTDRQMMIKLKMSEKTFYWYKAKMYQKYGNIQRAKTEDAVYTQQALLAERLTRLYTLCELKLRTTMDNMSGVEVAALGSFAQELSINILKLECEGLRATTRGLNNIVQEKSTRYLATSGAELESNTIPDTTTGL